VSRLPVSLWTSIDDARAVGEVDPLIEIPFDVREHEHGTRLDVFLSRRISRMSRSVAARLIRLGRVRRGATASSLRPSARVFEGEIIIVKRRPLEEGPTDDIEIPILYRDDDLVAVSKPGDLVVHPTASHYRRTLIRIMRSRLAEEELDLAHRIDKETSGVLLLARNFEASSDLKVQFQTRRVKKSYLALVAGTPAIDEVELDASMRLAQSESKCVMEVHPSGLPSLTDVRVLARGRDAALVEARPHTGRQHQIRVHLMHWGHPIIGDKLYVGGEQFFMDALDGHYAPETIRARVGHDRQALHAHRTVFRHPGRGSTMEIRAPLPPDLVALAAAHDVPVPAEATTAGAVTETDE
jgi:23S rRNA pseudouridine1911/1915/1917 synthase